VSVCNARHPIWPPTTTNHHSPASQACSLLNSWISDSSFLACHLNLPLALKPFCSRHQLDKAVVLCLYSLSCDLPFLADLRASTSPLLYARSKHISPNSASAALISTLSAYHQSRVQKAQRFRACRQHSSVTDRGRGIYTRYGGVGQARRCACPAGCSNNNCCIGIGHELSSRRWLAG
jgi:hypothetical protein